MSDTNHINTARCAHHVLMSQVAKLFTNGRSQAVRLPAAYWFDTKRCSSAKTQQPVM